MPDTFNSLVLFVAVLAPGLVYTSLRERRRPPRRQSVIRETASLVLASALCNATVFIALAAMAAMVANDGLDELTDFATSPGAYFRRHPIKVAAGGSAAIVLACGLGAGLASVADRVPDRLKPKQPGVVAPHLVDMSKVTDRSVWWDLFTFRPDERVHIGCYLDDGTYLAGHLSRFSPWADETADRDLALARPVQHLAPDADRAEEIDALVVVSAARLRFLTVAYEPAEDAEPEVNAEICDDAPMSTGENAD